MQTFLVVWQTINENYFDKTFNGLNWNNIKKEYEPRVRNTKTDDELYEILQEMISRLERSHLQIIPPEVYDVVEEAKEKAKSEEERDENTDDEKDSEDEEGKDESSDTDALAEYGIGIDLRFIENQFVITQIKDDSSAQKAGLKTGYIIEKINGVSLKEFLETIRQYNKNSKSFEQKVPIQIVKWFLNANRTLLCNLMFWMSRIKLKNKS